ncbi:MAG: CoA transferase [Chloroflexi bacterium]|nr:CoA transferase [Chloroflexota bacterium]
MSERALARLKVLEFCDTVAGSFCCKLMGDLGAEVVKVERPGTGSKARQRGPFLRDIPHHERSALFLYLNTNKLGITLDPRIETGARIFKDLVKKVDLLVEDTRPGTMKKLGLDYKPLAAPNQRLVVTSVTPFGQTGPYRRYKAYHMNIYHAGGDGYLLPSGLGWELYPDREPLAGGGYLGEYQAGINAAVATLGALYARDSHGQGQQVDVSIQESLIALNRRDMARYGNEGESESRATGIFPVGGLYECKDGFVEISLIEDHEWAGLVALMGSPDWATEERYKTRAGRDAAAAKLQPLIRKWMLQHTKEEVYRGAQAKRCAAGRVSTPEEVVNSEHLKARGFFVEAEHPEAGRLKYPTSPALFSRTPFSIQRTAPLLGQHNEKIYTEWLGLDREELVRLGGDGII